MKKNPKGDLGWQDLKEENVTVSDCITVGLFTVIVVYVVFSVMAIGLGIDHRGDTFSYINKCDRPQARFIYAFPAYKLGCWLGEVVEEK